MKPVISFPSVRVLTATFAFIDVNECSVCPTKIGQFELALVVDEQVLRLQVSVEDFPLVTVGQTTQQLEHENLPER